MKKLHERLITLAGVAALVGTFFYMYWPLLDQKLEQLRTIESLAKFYVGPS